MIYVIGKYFFVMSTNSRSLLPRLARIQLQRFDCTEIHANDLGTFVGNQGDHLGEEVEMKFWDQEPPVRVTEDRHFEAVKFQLSHVYDRHRHTGHRVATKLALGILAVSKPS